MKIFKLEFLLPIAICFFLNGCSKSGGTPSPPPPPPPPPVVPTVQWEFETNPVWSDEFDLNGNPDNSKWNFELGGNGWGNNELEYYTDNGNAVIQDGLLKITAKKESLGAYNYTSARMTSKTKGDWKYGRFEIRARIPAGRGTWPAIWLLNSDNAYGDWPRSGEIDIMEHVGYDPNIVHFTVHNQTYYGANGKGSSQNVPTALDSFHVYRCDWTPAGIRAFIDGSQYFEYTNSNKGVEYWPYDKNFFMILNVAVGGNWGGAMGVDDSVFPATLEVDYVRVYKFLK